MAGASDAKDDGPGHSIRRNMEEGFNLSSAIVEVVVGSGSATKSFYIHQDRLVKHSEFFRAALNGSWIKSKTGMVALPEQYPEYFAMFAQFTYQGQIFTVKEGDRESSEDDYTSDKELGKLRECWMLGQVLLATPFKDAIVDAMASKVVADGASLSWQNELYTSAPASSQVRKFIVEMVLHCWDDKDFNEEHMADAQLDFCKEVIKGWANGKRVTRKHQEAFMDCGCKYHEHVKEAMPCYKTMF